MAKISQEAKKQYADRVQAYKQEIDAIQLRERTIRADIESDSGGGGYKRLALADERLNLASLYLLLNRVSLGVLGIKNDNHLNDARKCCYQSIIYLEEVVGDQIGTVGSLDQLQNAVSGTSPDVLVLGCDQQVQFALGERILSNYPQLRVVALEREGQTAFVCRQRTEKLKIDEVSPGVLLHAVKGFIYPVS